MRDKCQIFPSLLVKINHFHCHFYVRLKKNSVPLYCNQGSFPINCNFNLLTLCNKICDFFSEKYKLTFQHCTYCRKIACKFNIAIHITDLHNINIIGIVISIFNNIAVIFFSMFRNAFIRKHTGISDKDRKCQFILKLNFRTT